MRRVRATCTPAGATAVVGVVAVVGSFRRARQASVGPGEELVFRWFNRRTGRIETPVWVLMQTGSLAAVFVLAGEAARRGRARSAVLTAVYGTAVWAGVKLVKPGVRRGRPEDHLDGVVVRGARQSGLGYPSGHAAVALALGLMAPQALGVAHRPAHDLAAAGLAAATGATRMYVGAHLPLDVVGGLGIGVLTGRVGSLLLRRSGRRSSRRRALSSDRGRAPAACRRPARGSRRR
jgi:undecaprenyl-diphosphatase